VIRDEAARDRASVRAGERCGTRRQCPLLRTPPIRRKDAEGPTHPRPTDPMPCAELTGSRSIPALHLCCRANLG
jgi:hypothetical protein